MANYWAIAIGINQYQLFPPLNYAQADAEAIRNFLVTEAGFLPQNCLLMKNTAAEGDKGSYPTKESILFLLEELTAKSWQPDDHLWLFFSGYGINYQGKDYLMSVEADPDQVLETGIEVRTLMQSLRVAELNVLLVLDINRAFGTQADDPVGEETVELAKELQIATILSCQPEEFSHENSDLGHGFFTTVLLEALRSGEGGNLTDLANYLHSRTPKLCQEHWRPLQNPVIVIPSPAPTILPPPPLVLELDPSMVIFPEESFAVAGVSSSLRDNSEKPQNWWTEGRTVPTTLSQISPNPQISQQPELISDSPTQPATRTSPDLNLGGRFIPPASQTYPSTQSNNPIWQQFILWGGGIMVAVGIIATFFLSNYTHFRFQQLATTASEDSNSHPFPETVPSNSPTMAPATNSRIGFSTASPRRSQALLALAKMSLKPNQASDLSQAIAKSRQTHPLSTTTEENIQVWNQMILDLAVSRAKQGEYNQAIAAAHLIAKDETIYPQAETAINQWRLELKQYFTNQTLLDAANALIEHGQASSYNRAIEVAKKVAASEPGFDNAQKSINRWSEKILDLAKKRAANGELTAAIQTATLVPTATSAYDDAQDAMQKWRGKEQH